MNNKIITGIILLIIAGALVLIMQDKRNQPSPADGKLSVVASFYPLAFFAEQIGGDRATVTNITPAGVEPHDYELTPLDVVKIEKSKLLILNGGNLEPWIDNVRNNIDPNQTLLVIAGEGLTTQSMVEESEKIIDPHVWLSPPLAKQMVDTIAQRFIQIDSTHAATYEANAAALKSKLDALDADYKRGLSNCAKRDIITSHAAFGYLATTYQLNQVPIAGLEPDAEPSSRELSKTADFAKKNNIKYIFFETLVSPKLAETLANEVGAQTLVFNPLEGLSDKELAENKDYFTEMRNNLANLQIALECQTS